MFGFSIFIYIFIKFIQDAREKLFEAEFNCQINPGGALVFQHPYLSKHNCKTSTCIDSISLLQSDNFSQNNLRKKKALAHAHILPHKLHSIFVHIAARKGTLISIISFLLCLYPNYEHSKVTKITNTPTFLCRTKNGNTHHNFLALISLLSCNDNAWVCLKIKISLSDPKINTIYIHIYIYIYLTCYFYLILSTSLALLRVCLYTINLFTV